MVTIDEDELDKDIQNALNIHHRVNYRAVSHLLTLITFFIAWIILPLR